MSFDVNDNKLDGSLKGLELFRHDKNRGFYEMNVYVTSRPFTASESGAMQIRGEYVCMLLFRLASCAQKINYDCNI